MCFFAIALATDVLIMAPAACSLFIHRNIDIYVTRVLEEADADNVRYLRFQIVPVSLIICLFIWKRIQWMIHVMVGDP